MRHLLLLLPFLLFDLLHEEVKDFNTKNESHHISPVSKLITLVLALLEWYRFYRYEQIIYWKYIEIKSNKK